MSVEDKPIEDALPASQSSPENEAADPSAAAGMERGHAVRDTVVAVAVLAAAAASVGLYFHFSGKTDSAPSGTAVSAASWLGVSDTEAGSNVGGDTDGYAPSGDAVENGAPEAKRPSGEAASEVFAANTEKTDPDARTGTVQSGVPVITSLQKLGLSLQQAHAVISSLKGVFDFRKSRPGDTFSLKVDDAGAPTYFHYRVSLTEVYEVERNGDTLKGRRKHIPTTHTTRRFGGTISSSLYKTLSSLGADPSLSGKIVGVLANEVNFYKEQRPGDTFRVVVDEESLNGTFLGYGPVSALEYSGVKSGKKRFFLLDVPGREPEYFNEKGISQPRSVIAIPLHYTRISSPFGTRWHPVLKRRAMHNGVDFAAGVGEPVWACREGSITIASKKGANGNLAAIRHDDGLESFYAHLHRFASGIKPGVTVKKRQVIGYVGNTGRSTGPHLHFGMKKNGKFIDPLKYRVQPGRPPEAKYRKALKEIIKKRGRLLDRTRIVPAAEPLEKTPDAESEVLGVEDW